MTLELAARMDMVPAPLSEALAAGQQYVVRQNETFAAALDERFAGAVTEKGGGRIRACIDHAVGRRQIYQNQCAGVHFPFLPAVEYFDREMFPWITALESRTEAIRREALALIATGQEAIRPYVRQDAGTPQNKWSPLDGSGDWSACFLWEYGERNAAICRLCPETTAALLDVPQTDIPGKAPTAFFSILRARSRIPPHTGVTNTRTIIHLPLVVPDRCGFRVGGETRVWREGEAFAFDDTIEHEAWNDSDDMRVVLIFDVWNPYLHDAERGFLKEFFQIADRQ